MANCHEVHPPKAQRSVNEVLRRSGIVAVLRASQAAGFVPVAAELVAAGVQAIEVTLTAPDALEALTALRGEVPQGVILGAGTVLTEQEAANAIAAGADFLVAPSLVPDVVRFGLTAGVPVYPGALTPSEFVAAQRSGADLVKLFPAARMGPGYLRDLHGPLPDLEIMPTGGIGVEDVSAWLCAGAVAVGLGGPLLGDALEGGSIRALRRRTETALDQVRAARVPHE